MSLRRLAGQHRPLKVSFEFFPPRTAEMEEQLWRAIRRLEPLGPAFVSVTYGAGGSTRERTHATVKRIVDETSLAPAAHLTCVASPKAEIEEVVRGYWNAGIRHIVALRGDMPDGSASYAAHPSGYASTPELIAAIRAIAPFEVSVGTYPERHPDSRSLDHDVELLKAKVAAGACRAITQFGFDNRATARFRDLVAKRGLDIAIVPGLMPTTNIKGVRRMAAKAGASIPGWLNRLYEGLDDDAETRKLVAAAVLAEQVEELRAEGFDQFHFYTLNQADLTYAACRILGMQPLEPQAKATQ
jgi:methylenetetrahydrofolate reductase (NADPH)